MNQPLVSVVIATYNMGRYLPDAVRSVLEQTWKNIELIVVDDGSTDDTAAAIESFLVDPRVRYFFKANEGQTRTKNVGIQAAYGEYLAFCDADDLWEADKLERQMPHLLANPALGVVYSTVSQIDEHGHLFKDAGHVGYSGKITEQLIISNFIPFGTAVVRRKCLNECGIFDESLPMGIDWDLWLRISVRWEFFFLQVPTYRYRVWSGQMSKNVRGRYMNAVTIMEKFLRSFPGAVSPRIVRRAWADTYTGRAMAIATTEHKFFEPLWDTFRAIRMDPLYGPAWRVAVKILSFRVKA